MLFTIDQIKSLYIPDEFGTSELDYFEGVENIVDQLRTIYNDTHTDVNDLDFDELDEEGSDEEWIYHYGASKFVIAIDEKTVVKIPFNGIIRETGDPDDWEGYFCPFEICEDYCDLEASIYADAVAAGVSQFFAKTVWGGVMPKNTRFNYYISDRVTPYSPNKNKPSKNSLEKAKKIKSTPIPIPCLALLYDYYTEEDIYKFLNFIIDNGIDDLHSGNWGVAADGRLVLLDYSGYLD